MPLVVVIVVVMVVDSINAISGRCSDSGGDNDSSGIVNSSRSDGRLSDSSSGNGADGYGSCSSSCSVGSITGSTALFTYYVDVNLPVSQITDTGP